MLTKRSTMIALTVLAALSVEIGCGAGDHKVSSRKTIPQVGAQSGTVTRQKMNLDGSLMVDANGKPVMETVSKADAAKPRTGPDGKPIMPKLNVPTADANLDKVTKLKDSLAAGTPIPREKLDSGTYDLQTIETVAQISGAAAGEDTRAYLKSNFISNGNNGFQLQAVANSALSAGNITQYNETPRNIDFPANFKVDLSTGPWAPNRKASPNMTFVDTITTGSGKATLADDLQPENYIPSSFWNLIGNGTLQNDGSYRYDDSGKSIYLRLLKQSNTLVVYMSFEEQRATDSSTAKTTADRFVFFTYKITPDNVKPADPAATQTQPQGGAQTPAPGDDPITVHNIDPAAGADQGNK